MFNPNLAAAASQIFGARLHASRPPATRIVEFLRTGLRRFSDWRTRRRERQKLFE
jgi:hypothetical protein